MERSYSDTRDYSESESDISDVDETTDEELDEEEEEELENHPLNQYDPADLLQSQYEPETEGERQYREYIAQRQRQSLAPRDDDF